MPAATPKTPKATATKKADASHPTYRDSMLFSTF